MLKGWGRAVVRLRWSVLAAGLVIALTGVGWGSGVFASLTSGGFDDPDSESMQAAERIAAELGARDVDLVVLYSSETATVDDQGFRESVTSTIEGLRDRPEVASAVSYYDTQAPAMVSTDERATYAAINLSATDDNDKRADYDALAPALAAPGLTTEVGGMVAFQATTDELTERDIVRGEMLAMPLVLILLAFVFRGVVAALMPLLIGVLAILGAFTATRLLTTVTDVSTFAVNTITLLGLGMAIDYSLLMVSRFREELAAGHSTSQAVARTMITAGRTVLVSGITIVSALASLLIFPQVFLRSMGMGGMAAVLVAMLGSLTVLPALLAVLGPKINALRVPLPRRRRRATKHPAREDQGGWARLTHGVMRRPILYLTTVLVALAALAAPFAHAQFGGVDERVLPADSEARVVTERIRRGLPRRHGSAHRDAHLGCFARAGQ